MVLNLKQSYGIKYPVCQQTVCTWMHQAGGEYIKRKQNYYCDGHETKENQEARRNYILRDMGTKETPSMRELGQRQWIQMSQEKSNEILQKHDPNIRDVLRSKGYTFPSKTTKDANDQPITMVEYHLEDSEMFDVSFMISCVSL